MKKYTSLLLLSFTLILFSATSIIYAKSPYHGQEKRLIKSLSNDDVNQLENGKGWGFAKAAELNGVPGPLHILELKKEIKLSKKQEQKVKDIYSAMNEKAVILGKEFISLETQLDQEFKRKSITEERLKSILKQISEVRFRLRYTHMSAHLQAMPLLSDDQLKSYIRLRGYADNPCDTVPKGHNPAMWRKHNGCK